MKLTVFFDGSFWCGLIEEQTDESLKVYKHLFGAEPKDIEVLTFVNQQLLEILATTPAVKTHDNAKDLLKINPKRRQRMLNREKKQPVYSTKAQDAMQQVLELKKTQRKKTSKAKKQVEQQLRFQMKQAKKLQKKKGH
ncbi:hypothetical protein M2139_002413 [Enterococcus sp. PF1-24]|uniref:YjdF family protein n=1 Tax=unclassified Enterococcus TaxID=2608891 RepID=UPI00247439BF|nr:MULTISPECIES: YjdF family protein [unclassified Enterococcus]MDH6365417.1 hypothetical protein [Enterococcus sp. PFB1-1]MDH6402511.1 hypothetical protein [Enterococcus sp. PF1-24]